MRVTDRGNLKSADEKPEQVPHSVNSKWVHIHLLTGNTCLGFYSFKQATWKEFKDLKNLYHATPLADKAIKGWNY